jgi:hypothetical protein
VSPWSPLFLLLPACQGWPTYANLPVDSGTIVRYDALPGDAASVTWTQLPSPDEDGTDDDPRGMSAEGLSEGRGNYFAGRLAGSGWDPTQTDVERWEECGDVAQFPPYDNGMYLGDWDWRVVDIESTGTFCSWFKFNQPGGQADVLVYAVNACNLPTTPYLYESGDPVGYNVAGQLNTWSYPIESPTRVAVVAAAWAPNDPSASWVYEWGLSLLTAAEDGDEVVCPAPPTVAGGS